MKVGVLTFHKSINYGSALQAWATQDMLKKAGYDAEVINYEPSGYSNLYNLYQKGRSPKTIVRNILRVPLKKYKLNQIKLFSEFVNQCMSLSEFRITSEDDIRILGDKYDCIICGSDQIWNVHASDCDDVYFLPNVKTKKIAFSVSVNNTDYTETRCNDEMKRWMSDFELLTCREASGAKKISDFLGGVHIDTFLDPTLMHRKDDFFELCSDRIVKEDYIFLYKVWGGRDSYKLVAKLSEKYNLPVYTLLMPNSNVASLIQIEKEGIKVIKEATGPKDYLSLIRNANLVATDSFHGTAFSIIFERPFLCVNERREDGSVRNDERLVNILKIVGLEDRYMLLEDLDKIEIDRTIDYTIVTKKRLEIAESNKKILFEAINSDKGKEIG